MRHLYLPAVFLLAPFLAPGQPVLVGTPGMGVAYDSRSMMLRPILGIPGASLLGDAINSDSLLVFAAISPLNDRAIGVTQDGQVRLIRFGDLAESFPLETADSSARRVVFAPSGRAALLIGSRIQVAVALDSSPALSVLPSPELPDVPIAAALSDDGRIILLSSGSGTDQRAWLTWPEGGAVQLPLPGAIVTAGFRANSHDAVALTRTGDVYTIRDAGPNAEFHQIYTGDEATADPVGVRFSPDGARVFVASSAGILTAIDIRTGNATTISCHCKPAGLEPLRGGTVFRLNEISDRPLMLFDASTSDPRIWFVPADTVTAGEEGSVR